jgi:hypothetical protein
MSTQGMCIRSFTVTERLKIIQEAEESKIALLVENMTLLKVIYKTAESNIPLEAVSPRGTYFESIYIKCFRQSLFIKIKL